ncbi:Phenol regulator MopR [Georgfuchsia toluolica]|uniref:Phenol regulator MopR n=1 Tax=Georgfuchsia toluolica TaxID=424218 RepID=A0A916J2A6_9PROT|nr:sigma-54-dependent Fis family transcriptional regulator [Georgfuchsia toluolica]CAG4883282.1 Phenol regulator MopR [Georgfuchsia toluolica]
MTKLRSVGRITNGDLRARMHFCAETGQIWLHEHRMLLVHAEAQGTLRKELIDTLGMDRARGILTRMGYASGVRDAELARTRAEDSSDQEAFMTGPQLHTLEGIVQVMPVKLELNRHTGKFYAEFLWEHSWEGQSHRRLYGIHSEPVCWSQIGYACGYSSAFMGRTILYKEVECTGMGHNNCRIIGKPAEEWEDAAEQMRFFNSESIADQLIDLQTQVVQLRSSIGDRDQLPQDVMGISPGFRAAYDLLKQAAASHITVLLQGETGVGKEVFARSLHEMGPRCSKPFVAVNCAAIPHELVESELFGVEKGAYTGALVSRPGRFERADGGTLFLDEIGDLPASVQAKLLRVLQDGEIERLGDQKTRKVNMRLVVASNLNLQQLVKEGRFRSDLYYRLNAFQVVIPPLRERKQDIPLLAKHFLAKHTAINGKKLRGFTDKAKRALLAYPWPGNIRELQNVVERGVMLAPGGTRIEVKHLFLSSSDEQPQEFGLDPTGGLDINCWETGKDLLEAVFNGVLTLDQIEAMLLETAVDKARGNLSSAARLLGLTRAQIAYRLKRLHEGKAGENDAALRSLDGTITDSAICR